MLAYHNDAALRKSVIAEMAAHRKADELVQEAIKKNLLTIDIERGCIYGERWGNGKKRGCLNLKGYRVFTLHLDKKRVQAKAHRAIWIAKNGKIPEGFVIDHINGKKDDNRISNLRLADPLLNS